MNNTREVERQEARASEAAAYILENVMHRQRWSAQVLHELSAALLTYARREIKVARKLGGL